MIEDTAISARAVGQYQLSIATSLAIESLMGIHPEIVVKSLPLNHYKELWVNIRTLFRNLIGSLHKDAVYQVHPVELGDALIYEIDAIRHIIADGSRGKTKIVFYMSEYKDFEHKYPYASLRSDNTPKQHDYTNLQDKTLEVVIASEPEAFKVFKRKLKTTNKADAAIITHIAYDLLSRYQFHNLTLLESHTGVFKTPDMWYTKYYNGKDIPFMPFHEELLQVFGDSEHFRPMDIRLKRDLVELAKEFRWSSVTSIDRIKSNVASMKNPVSKETMKNILI